MIRLRLLLAALLLLAPPARATTTGLGTITTHTGSGTLTTHSGSGSLTIKPVTLPSSGDTIAADNFGGSGNVGSAGTMSPGPGWSGADATNGNAVESGGTLVCTAGCSITVAGNVDVDSYYLQFDFKQGTADSSHFMQLTVIDDVDLNQGVYLFMRNAGTWFLTPYTRGNDIAPDLNSGTVGSYAASQTHTFKLVRDINLASVYIDGVLQGSVSVFTLAHSKAHQINIVLGGSGATVDNFISKVL